MNIPEITTFQLKSLEDSATAKSPNWMMMQPLKSDDPVTYERWTKNNRETDELVALGLADNISLQFGKQIHENIVKNGRGFRVFRITDLGRLLFRASRTQLIN